MLLELCAALWIVVHPNGTRDTCRYQPKAEEFPPGSVIFAAPTGFREDKLYRYKQDGTLEAEPEVKDTSPKPEKFLRDLSNDDTADLGLWMTGLRLKLASPDKRQKVADTLRSLPEESKTKLQDALNASDMGVTIP